MNFFVKAFMVAFLGFNPYPVLAAQSAMTAKKIMEVRAGRIVNLMKAEQNLSAVFEKNKSWFTREENAGLSKVFKKYKINLKSKFNNIWQDGDKILVGKGGKFYIQLLGPQKINVNGTIFRKTSRMPVDKFMADILGTLSGKKNFSAYSLERLFFERANANPVFGLLILGAVGGAILNAIGIYTFYKLTELEAGDVKCSTKGKFLMTVLAKNKTQDIELPGDTVKRICGDNIYTVNNEPKCSSRYSSACIEKIKEKSKEDTASLLAHQERIIRKYRQEKASSQKASEVVD